MPNADAVSKRLVLWRKMILRASGSQTSLRYSHVRLNDIPRTGATAGPESLQGEKLAVERMKILLLELLFIRRR